MSDTVQETYFFRDRAHFDHVEELLRAAVDPVQIWSAGCASGEEPYSLAILAEELGVADRVRIVATDVSRQAIEKARTAKYRRWSFRGSAPSERWFTRRGDHWVLAASLRERVELFRHDLAGDFDPGLFDVGVIFCRNVLIHVPAARHAAIAERLYRALAPGGWLICGPSDPLLSTYAPFEIVTHRRGIFHRRPAVETFPAELPEPKRELPPGVSEWVKRIRAESSLELVDRALADHPLSAELEYIRAELLLEHKQTAAAEVAIRRALYLDQSLILPRYLLATILAARGDRSSARRELTNTIELSSAVDPETPVLLGDGIEAGRLAAAARLWLEQLDEVKP